MRIKNIKAAVQTRQKKVLYDNFDQMYRETEIGNETQVGFILFY
jgi:hypothetical protein